MSWIWNYVLGQMLDDVNLAIEGCKPVRFYGRTGGSYSNRQQSKLLHEILGGVK